MKNGNASPAVLTAASEAGLRPGNALPGLLPFEPSDVEYSETPTVLLLDGSETSRKLLRGMLKSEPYRVLEASCPSEAFEILQRDTVDLIVLDLVLPEMSGAEFCRAVKSDRKTQLIPLVMLTSVQGIETEISGIASGADEFLTKPLNAAVVRTRLRALLRMRAAINSLEEAETILFSLARAVEHRDRYTAGHCERLAFYSVAVGMRLGLDRRDLLALHRGGYLHDIGKIAIPDAILYKRGPLSDEEWVIMKRHTVKGEEICRPMKSLRSVLPIIRSHHERWDGSGYPDGLRGEQIPLTARILQIADIFDALTTARPYKPALSADQALKILEEEAERGWRDPRLVKALAEVIPEAQAPCSGLWPQLEALERAEPRASLEA
ncbi:MAG: HD domain-containing protein [Bryobacterales bacterium]|nr:HD domain-containing protein [Bryobacteraceae bacterium]MDW8355861.1 HD domain-containing protein [Bryobacterales bacterium]